MRRQKLSELQITLPWRRLITSSPHGALRHGFIPPDFYVFRGAREGKLIEKVWKSIFHADVEWKLLRGLATVYFDALSHVCLSEEGIGVWYIRRAIYQVACEDVFCTSRTWFKLNFSFAFSTSRKRSRKTFSRVAVFFRRRFSPPLSTSEMLQAQTSCGKLN